MHRAFADGGNLQDYQFLTTLLSGSVGAIIGVVGTIVSLKLQNRAADRRHRTDIAVRFYSRAQGMGVRATRNMRRAGSFDLPMEAGWDIQLIEMVREIDLLYDTNTTLAAEEIVGALTEIVEYGTVGSMMRFDNALPEFVAASGIHKRTKPRK